MEMAVSTCGLNRQILICVRVALDWTKRSSERPIILHAHGPDERLACSERAACDGFIEINGVCFLHGPLRGDPARVLIVKCLLKSSRRCI